MSTQDKQIAWTCSEHEWPWEGEWILRATKGDHFFTVRLSGPAELSEAVSVLEKAWSKRDYALAGWAALHIAAYGSKTAQDQGEGLTISANPISKTYRRSDL